MIRYGYIFCNTTDQVEEGKRLLYASNCSIIYMDNLEAERDRPNWKALQKELNAGDELVITKLANVVRGISKLAFFFKVIQIKKVRLISLEDKIDTINDESQMLFPPLSCNSWIKIIASMPLEVSNNKKMIEQDKPVLTRPSTSKGRKTRERDTIIINLYNAKHSIEDIINATNSSRSTIYRILKKNHIEIQERKRTGMKDDLILQYMNQGLTLDEILSKIGYKSKQTLYKRIRIIKNKK